MAGQPHLPSAADGRGDEVACERWIEKPYYRDLGAAKIGRGMNGDSSRRTFFDVSGRSSAVSAEPRFSRFKE
jgi:hypothetical protein